jgi:hypothetical protein
MGYLVIRNPIKTSEVYAAKAYPSIFTLYKYYIPSLVYSQGKNVCHDIPISTDPNIVEDASMSIYLPYVYKVTNKHTKKFYIGMRSANKDIAENDLGIKYFTSNKKIKENFKDFNIEIIAYFKDWESAFVFENISIKEEWGNPNILN